MHKLKTWFKQRFCRHEVNICDFSGTGYGKAIRREDSRDNKLHWWCTKCDKEFILDYGLQVKAKIIRNEKMK